MRESKLAAGCAAGFTTVQSFSVALARQPVAPVSFANWPVSALRAKTITVSIVSAVPPALA